MANIAGKITAGENCRIDAFVTITGNLKLGKNVHIGTGACIFAAAGVEIGDGSTISPGTKIFTGTDDVTVPYVSNPQVKERKFHVKPVKIGSYVTIGANAIVVPGAVIGDDVQVGCLSMVRGNLDSESVYAGIPATRIKDRVKVIRD